MEMGSSIALAFVNYVTNAEAITTRAIVSALLAGESEITLILPFLLTILSISLTLLNTEIQNKRARN